MIDEVASGFNSVVYTVSLFKMTGKKPMDFFRMARQEEPASGYHATTIKEVEAEKNAVTRHLEWRATNVAKNRLHTKSTIKITHYSTMMLTKA